MLRRKIQSKIADYLENGSQLGIALNQTLSKPGRAIEVVRRFQLDFEEFLWANNVRDA